MSVDHQTATCIVAMATVDGPASGNEKDADLILRTLDPRRIVYLLCMAA